MEMAFALINGMILRQLLEQKLPKQIRQTNCLP